MRKHKASDINVTLYVLNANLKYGYYGKLEFINEEESKKFFDLVTAEQNRLSALKLA